MATDNNKINDLAGNDSDPTSELEPLRETLRKHPGMHDEAEADEDTFDFDRLEDTGEQVALSVANLQSDIRARNENISRLQFDIEQLRARWTGLETEIRAREELTDRLHEQLRETQQKLARTEALLSQRDNDIDVLQTRLKSAQALLASVEREAEDFSRTAQTGETVVSELRNSIEDQQSKIKSHLKEAEEARKDRDLAAIELEHLRKEKARLDEVVKASKLSVDKANAANQRLEKKLGDTETSLRTSKAKIAELTSQITERQSPALQEQSVRAAAQDAVLLQNSQELAELNSQIARTEEYADGLRRQLQTVVAANEIGAREQDRLQHALKIADNKATELSELLEVERSIIEDLRKELGASKIAFQEEVRKIRFELGGAQESIAHHETINEQLASDLFDHREFQQALESQLQEVADANERQTRDLRRRLRKAEQQRDDIVRKLESKDNAIAALLSELASRSHTIESIGEIGNVIHEIDGRMSNRIDEKASGERDRMARLLIGVVDGKELQFPLFKDRLTIGRTAHNDIQLKAQFISRRHALIVTENEQTRIVDWGSKNGVYVNDSRISEHHLQHGDIVAIGTAEFRYEERLKR